MADNYQNTGFSELQWNSLQRLMRIAPAGEPGPPGPPGPAGPQGTPAPAPAENTGHGNRWNPGEVGLFDPMYDGKSAATGEPIVHAGKDTYFRDVNDFIDRVRDMADVKGAELVRQNLYTCFRGIALSWYTTILTEDQKRLVKLGNGVDEWVRALHKRFKESAGTAMSTINRERYTMEDARRRREPSEYAHTISKAAKSTAMNTYSQLWFIYNGLDTEFQRDVTKPTEHTDMDAFLQEMEESKEIWWSMGSRYSRSHGSGYQSSRPANNFRPAGQQGPYNSSNRPAGGSLPQGGYGSGPGNAYAPAGNQQPPRQTQYPTTYQYSNPNYQNRAYQNQSNYRQNPPPPPAGAGQPYVRSQPPPQGQPYRPTGPMPSNTYQQPRNASGLQPKPSQQPYRPGNAYPNQYQNRPPYNQQSYGQRPNPAQQGQRAYLAEDGQEGLPEEAFPDQDVYDYGYDYGYTPQEEGPGEAFHEHAGEEQPPDEASVADEEIRSFFTAAPECTFSCRRCDEKFPSNNKLHYHLRRCKKVVSSSSGKSKPEAFCNLATAASPARRVVRSTAPPDSAPGFGFRSWRYARVKANINPATPEILDDICTDSGAGPSMADRSFLQARISDYASKVLRKEEPLKINGIGSAAVETNEYIPIDFTIPGEVDGEAANATFTRHVYIVENLKANILLGNDILGPEDIVPHVGKGKVTIGSCGNFSAPLTVVARDGERVKRTVRAQANAVIPAHSCSAIPIKIRGRKLPDRDLMFNPGHIERLGKEGGVFAHIVDANFSIVQVRNTTDEPVTIKRSERLGTLAEYEEEGCYLASSEVRHLAAGSWSKRALKLGVAALAALTGIAATSSSSSSAKSCSQPAAFSSVPTLDAGNSQPSQEYVMPSGITVYGTHDTAQQIASVAEAFPNLWKDDGATVNLPPDEWMPIELQPDAKVVPSKVYPVGQADRDFIDQEFDKLQRQGKLEYTTQPTPFSYPVFVVWRTIHKPDEPPERKGRVVVDIRGLNKITKRDTYPMPLQADVTALVAGCPYISVFDAASFFYQWLVQIADRHKLTVVSHRGQEQFNVAVMGYTNSPAYVQRKIDAILRVFRAFARAYVDDIVVFSKTLEEHLAHLHQVFQLLDSYNIRLSPKKSYLGYPTVALLGQKVDAFGLTIAADKLAAIANLRFPYTLKDLEGYLGFTGWLRNYIAWYAQKSNPLQLRKTMLLRSSPSNKGRQRKIYSARTTLEKPSEAEIESYNQLQEAFGKAELLIHHDPTRVTYIDVDASKRRGFGVVIYHLKPGADPNSPKQGEIQPIMFLSRMLTTAEERYWPTELEMAGLVWVVRKARHIIEASQHPTIVFTDHAANASIAKQTTLSSSNTDKLNLRLVRASAYLSQFQLDVRYRPGKRHILPDVLSRLPADRSFLDDGENLDLESYHAGMEDPSSNDRCLAYHGALIGMSPAFRQRLLDGYAKEKAWNNLIEMLTGLAKRLELEKPSQLPKPSATEKPLEKPSQPEAIPRQPTESANAAEEEAIRSPVPPASAEAIRSRAASPPVVNPEGIHQQQPEVSQQDASQQDASQLPESSTRKPRVYTGIEFELEDGLIYNLTGGRRRLCIPATCEAEVFRMAHDENQHAGRHRSYQRIADAFYVPRLSRKLRLYLEHCPECQLNQTRRHRPYGELVPISMPPRPFHTLAIDFIVALPGEWDALLTVTDKYSRRVMLIYGKTTYEAADWATLLIDRLLQADWGIPEAIISDRDPKFLSDLWKAVFKRLRTELLASTAYHSQTDGSSERTNQTVEIALRYLITTYPDVEHITFLPSLQAQLNNAANASTGLSPNEVIYGFRVKELTSAVGSQDIPEDIPQQRLEYQREAADATAFANAKAKVYYDARHQPIFFRPGDRVYLRLHQGYQLPGRPNKKMSNQRCGPFTVKRRAGRLAYELELPAHWRVYPVVSIAQLEPFPEEDPYNRPRPDYPDAVEVEGDTDDWRSYVVERILDKRIRKFGRTTVTQYMVKWLGWGPEYNEWRSLSYLDNCLELVEEYEERQRTKLSAAAASARRKPATSATPVTSDTPATAAAPKRGRGRPRKVPVRA